MTKIEIYDIEAEKLDELEEKTGYSKATIIEALLDIIESNDIDIESYI